MRPALRSRSYFARRLRDDGARFESRGLRGETAARGKDMPNELRGIPRRIVGFHRDEQGHWVADLACGHGQHVRHDPPWTTRAWVITEEGRREHLGRELPCLKCARGE